MHKGKIVFTGNFWEYFGLSIALLILSLITLGIALPYWAYWNMKYFVSKLEIQLDAPPPGWYGRS